MVDKTPAQITPGTANDESVVHASDATVTDFSRSHTEREIARLQSAILDYDAAKTYNIGDIVREQGLNWRNQTAIAVPEAFDVSKWQFIDNGLGILIVAYNTDTAVSLEFYAVGGGDFTGDADEDDAQAPSAGDFTLFQYTLSVQTNTTLNTVNWNFRVNGANANGNVQVGAGLTGTFQDLSNSDDMTTGDLMCYQYVEGAGGGALTIIGSGAGTSRTPT